MSEKAIWCSISTFPQHLKMISSHGSDLWYPLCLRWDLFTVWQTLSFLAGFPFCNNELKQKKAGVPDVMNSDVPCLTWWNASVSPNESEYLSFNSCYANLSSQITKREKLSTSGCHLWRPGRQGSRCLRPPTIRRLRESSLFRVASEENDERTLACESIRFFRRRRSDDMKYVCGSQGKRTREWVANPREAVASFSAPCSHLLLCVLLARVPLYYIP